MTYARQPQVDAYIAALPDWQQDTCREVRDLIHAADPEIEETIKYRGRPYFVLDGNVAALMGTKDHVNVFLYDPIVDGPRRDHHPRPRQRDRPADQDLPGRPAEHAGLRRDDQADRGPQSRRRLAAAHPTRLVRHRHCD